MQVMLISLERSGDYHNFETMTKNFAKPHINGGDDDERSNPMLTKMNDEHAVARYDYSQAPSRVKLV